MTTPEFPIGRLLRYVDANLPPVAPTRGTESTQPAEQDPDAHTDGTTAQEPTQTPRTWNHGDAEPADVTRVRDNDGDTWRHIRTDQWQCGSGTPLTWRYITDAYGPVTEQPDQPSKITDTEQVAATIGSLASRKADLESDDLHLLDVAWGVIANAGQGDWNTQTIEWREAAERWRDQYTARARSRPLTVANLRALLDGKSNHDVVSVELLRRVLDDGPGPVDLVDVEDLASLRRKAAMLPVVLLWRDATANALSALVAAVDEQGPGNALLAVAVAHARDVLTVDPEKAYGVAGPVEDVVELDWLRRELAAMRDAHDGACQTIAAMHAAAVGEVRGPIRGVVEDVTDLRNRAGGSRVRAELAEEARDRAEAESTRWKTRLVDETARLRGHLTKLRAERPRIWWPGDPQPEDVTRITTGTNREEMRLDPDGLWRPADAPAYPSNGMDWADMMANEGPLVDSAPSLATGGKTVLATIRIEFDPATRALLERAPTVATGGIIPDVAGVLRDAQFEVLRAAQRQARPNTAPVVGSDWTWYHAITHASPRCACGINDAGQRYIDLICQPRDV